MTRYILLIFTFSVIIGTIFGIIKEFAKSDAVRGIANGGQWASVHAIVICFFVLPVSLVIGLFK